jgi:hypothetical protein
METTIDGERVAGTVHYADAADISVRLEHQTACTCPTSSDRSIQKASLGITASKEHWTSLKDYTENRNVAGRGGRLSRRTVRNLEEFGIWSPIQGTLNGAEPFSDEATSTATSGSSLKMTALTVMRVFLMRARGSRS